MASGAFYIFKIILYLLYKMGYINAVLKKEMFDSINDMHLVTVFSVLYEIVKAE